MTLSIGPGQKEVLMAQRNQHLSFKYMEFVLTRIIFVTDIAVSTIETTKLVFKPIFLKQFHFLKPLDIFMTFLEYAKKVTLDWIENFRPV